MPQHTREARRLYEVWCYATAAHQLRSPEAQLPKQQSHCSWQFRVRLRFPLWQNRASLLKVWSETNRETPIDSNVYSITLFLTPLIVQYSFEQYSVENMYYISYTGNQTISFVFKVVQYLLAHSHSSLQLNMLGKHLHSRAGPIKTLILVISTFLGTEN